MNGAAVDLTKFIAKHAMVDQDVAQRMLITNVRTYTPQALLQAYSITLAELATGLVANAYKYMLGTAARVRDGRLKKSAVSKPTATEEKELADAFERARRADQEADRCRP